MTRRQLLAAGPLPPTALAALEARYVVHHLRGPAQRDAALAPALGAIEAVVGISTAPCPAELIELLPSLALIAVMGVGYDRVDLEAARRRGIAITNTPDVLTDDVADIAIGLMLAVMRRLPLADAYVRAGKWLGGQMPLGRTLAGRRLGIVGMGRIGRAVARRAEAFGMSVAYHGPRRKADLGHPFRASLVELARESDILAICAPGGPATYRLIDAEVLEALGPSGVLINVARGSLVDEEALVRALVGGTLGGAGLDVFTDEPRVPAELCGLENVVLLPHIGSATVETRRAMEELFLANVHAHFDGRPLLTPVPL